MMLHEPAPIWPNLPRLCPGIPFPSYRYVYGLNPHPTRSPLGHSYHKGKSDNLFEGAPKERWQENQAYLYGIDLYHRSYFWEAHEVWETLWMACNKGKAEKKFWQALIQNAAAQLKLHQKQKRGAATLSRKSWEQFYLVLSWGECDATGRFMGLSLPGVLQEMEAHYQPLWQGIHDPIPTLAPPPKLLPFLT